MTAIRIDGEPAFVMHTRAYRETSQLVDLFTRHYGRLRVVARGFRRPKTGGRVLEPFVPIVVGWSGKGELKNLVSAEPAGHSLLLKGNHLFSGFYLNELILRLLADHDPHETLFDRYLEVITNLSKGEGIEPALRIFESSLLDEVGYGLVLNSTCDSGTDVLPDGWYWFDPTTGVSERLFIAKDKPQPNWFRGSELLAIAAGEYTDQATAKSAKRLMRLAIQSLLGDKPLRSRELFIRDGAQSQEPQ